MTTIEVTNDVPLTARQFVELIDEFYHNAKLEKLSRFSIKWGRWSTKMNVELRQRIETKRDPEELKLKHVFIYWTLKSQLLELYYRYPSRAFKAGQKRRLLKEAADNRAIIFSVDGLNVPELDSQSAIQTILRGLNIA